MAKRCSVSGCEKPYSCKGMCKFHYEKKRCAEKGQIEKDRKKVYYENNKVVLLEKDRVRRLANPEKKKARDAAWYKAHPEHSKRYREENAEKIASNLAAWKALNPDYNSQWYEANKTRAAASSAAWAKKNIGKRNEITANRRAQKRKATPKWANKIAIGEYYALAAIKTRLTGESWHVDHIVPLQSKLVCGLHTDYNLQVISGRENSKKHNSYWPDMP